MKKIITLITVFVLLSGIAFAYVDIEKPTFLDKLKGYFKLFPQTVWGPTLTKIGEEVKFGILARDDEGHIGTGSCVYSVTIEKGSVRVYGGTGNLDKVLSGVWGNYFTYTFTETGTYTLWFDVTCSDGFFNEDIRKITVDENCVDECVVGGYACIDGDSYVCIKRTGEVCASWQLNKDCKADESCVFTYPYCKPKCEPKCVYPTECAERTEDGCGGVCTRETDGNSCSGGKGVCKDGRCVSITPEQPDPEPIPETPEPPSDTCKEIKNEQECNIAIFKGYPDCEWDNSPCYDQEKCPNGAGVIDSYDLINNKCVPRDCGKGKYKTLEECEANITVPHLTPEQIVYGSLAGLILFSILIIGTIYLRKRR